MENEARHNYQIIEDNFSENSTTTYDLSILVGIDRFFYIISNEQQRLLKLQTYPFNNKGSYEPIRDLLKNTLVLDSHLKATYRKTKIALFSPKMTLVPARLFKETEKKAYLERATGLSEQDYILSDAIQPLDIQNVYSFDKEVKNLLSAYFPNARYFHLSSALAKAIHAMPAFADGQHLFLNTVGDHIQIFYFNKKNIVFHNTFKFYTAEDYVYFVMLIIEQMQLSPETVPVTLLGEMMPDSKTHQLLHRYIRHIHFIKRPGFYHLGQKFDDIPDHLFFDLFSLKVCE